MRSSPSLPYDTPSARQTANFFEKSGVREAGEIAPSIRGATSQPPRPRAKATPLANGHRASRIGSAYASSPSIGSPPTSQRYRAPGNSEPRAGIFPARAASARSGRPKRCKPLRCRDAAREETFGRTAHLRRRRLWRWFPPSHLAMVPAESSGDGSRRVIWRCTNSKASKAAPAKDSSTTTATNVA